MKLSRLDACEKLELPNGADKDSVRTSYKRLALKWHPDKHDGAKHATKKFEEISVAYKRLTEDDLDSEDELAMTQNACFEQFQQVFFGRTIDAFSNGYDSSDEDYEDDDDEDEDDESDDQDFVGHFTDFYKSKSERKGRTGGNTDSPQFGLSAEEIEKNASDLITEEEREKTKAEKRRAKKKRRRDKKKAEKQKADQKKEEDSHSKQNGTADTKKKKDKKSKTNSSDVEDFDPNAAFFTQVVSKKKKMGSITEQSSSKKGKSKGGDNKAKEEETEDLDPVVLRSRQLAIRGNQMATHGHYQAAIDLFTEAIKLDPRDFRFFGNRSYCYDRILQYEKALRDADKAIVIASDWPKGYFRRGRALAGLKLYADAEQAFMQVLKLDRNCEDAMTELLRVRTFQLTEMGFSQEQAESAIKRYGSVQQALDSLLAGVGKDLRLRSHGNNKSLKVTDNSLVGEVYVSDDDDRSNNGASSHATTKSRSNSASVPRLQQHQQQAQFTSHNTSNSQQSQNKKQPADVKMNPTNPEGLTALWVGNVLPEVSEKQLRDMFGRHGTVTSVRCLPDKYCAFINYKTKEAAGRAMAQLQHEECAGQKLLIKFPDNPIVNGNVVLRKNNPVPTIKKKQTQVQQRYKKY